MIELFTDDSMFKEEVERLWEYRNLVEDSEDEKAICLYAHDVLLKYYSVESFTVRRGEREPTFFVKHDSIELYEKNEYLRVLPFGVSLEKEEYSIFWDLTGENEEHHNEIVSLYFTILLKRIHAVQMRKNIVYFSLRDPLTGLYNRKFLEEFSGVAEKQHQREGATYAVVMMDIDHFKHVNDTYGHQVGDEVIKSLSALVGEHTRDADVVTRYGGEEFLFLLYNTNATGARQVSQNISTAFSELQFGEKDNIFSCAVSCGIDILNKRNTSMKNVIGNADSALYYSKENGRNMISIHSETTQHKGNI